MSGPRGLFTAPSAPRAEMSTKLSTVLRAQKAKAHPAQCLAARTISSRLGATAAKVVNHANRVVLAVRGQMTE